MIFAYFSVKMESLTPIKQDLFEAKKKIGQQDGKIILLSSQLEKKKALLEEFHDKVRILTQTVQEKDLIIGNLNENLRISKDGGLTSSSSSLEKQIEALLKHINKSSDFRYVISGKEDTKYLLKSPVMLKSISSRNKTQCEDRTEAVKDLSSCTISPSAMKRKPPSPVKSKCSIKQNTPKLALFLSDLNENKENRSTNKPVFTSNIEDLQDNAIFKKVVGFTKDIKTNKIHKEYKKKDDVFDLKVIENALDDTFSAEAELTCYPLDDALDLSLPLSKPPKPPRAALQTIPPEVLSNPPKPLSSMSPAGFYGHIGKIWQENEKLKNDISRFKGRLEDLHAQYYYLSNKHEQRSHYQKAK